MRRPRTPGAGITGAKAAIKLGGAIATFLAQTGPIAQPETADTATGSNRLAVLAADIRAAHQDVTRGAQAVAERALAAGQMLTEAKDTLLHGAWEPWLAKHVGMSARTARRYMQLARAGLKTATVADLGIKGAVAAIARRKDSEFSADDDDSRYDYIRDRAEHFGISPAFADKCVRLAAIPEASFEAAIAAIKAAGEELTAEAVLSRAAGVK
jgi:hypothetical protein